MRQDIYDLAGLVGTFRTFQPVLPTTGLRIHRCWRLHRASCAALHRSVTLSRSIHASPMGPPSPAHGVLLAKGSGHRLLPSLRIHHLCLGSQRSLPYSADRGKQSVNRRALDELKQQIPLVGYLQAHDWSPARPLRGGRWMGLCPLHKDHKPSFLVDSNRNLFYCLRLWPRRRRDSLR
jgi:hypothetical protein